MAHDSFSFPFQPPLTAEDLPCLISMDATVSKDNANPTVYTSSGRQSVREGDLRNGCIPGEESSPGTEWWRDPIMHGQSSSRTRFSRLHLLDDESDAPDLSKAGQDDDVFPGGHSQNSEEDAEAIDSQEIFDLIRSITDPEHPLTLEQLAVVDPRHITVEQGDSVKGSLPNVLLEFTPTIPHCSMATLIGEPVLIKALPLHGHPALTGLSLRVRLLRSLPQRFKVDIRVRAGTHQSEQAVNKQLNDKERVAAALENSHLLDVVQNCLSSAGRRGQAESESLEQAEKIARELGVAI